MSSELFVDLANACQDASIPEENAPDVTQTKWTECEAVATKVRPLTRLQAESAHEDVENVSAGAGPLNNNLDQILGFEIQSAGKRDVALDHIFGD